jgi:hypothetical protein
MSREQFEQMNVRFVLAAVIVVRGASLVALS